MSSITTSGFPGQALRFNANLRFDTEEEFKQHAHPPDSDASSDNDVLWLSDSPFSQSPPEKPGLASDTPKVGWAAYWEKIQNEKKQNESLKQNGQPVPSTAESYPWNEKTVSLGPDIYTGSIITGVAGGVTNGKVGIRYHFDRQPGNLEDLEEPESQIY